MNFSFIFILTLLISSDAVQYFSRDVDIMCDALGNFLIFARDGSLGYLVGYRTSKMVVFVDDRCVLNFFVTFFRSDYSECVEVCRLRRGSS